MCHCSTTLSNHGLIRLKIFVSQAVQLVNFFSLYLIIYACIQIFDKIKGMNFLCLLLYSCVPVVSAASFQRRETRDRWNLASLGLPCVQSIWSTEYSIIASRSSATSMAELRIYYCYSQYCSTWIWPFHLVLKLDLAWVPTLSREHGRSGGESPRALSALDYDCTDIHVGVLSSAAPAQPNPSNQQHQPTNSFRPQQHQLAIHIQAKRSCCFQEGGLRLRPCLVAKFFGEMTL